MTKYNLITKDAVSNTGHDGSTYIEKSSLCSNIKYTSSKRKLTELWPSTVLPENS